MMNDVCHEALRSSYRVWLRDCCIGLEVLKRTLDRDGLVEGWRMIERWQESIEVEYRLWPAEEGGDC